MTAWAEISLDGPARAAELIVDRNIELAMVNEIVANQLTPHGNLSHRSSQLPPPPDPFGSVEIHKRRAVITATCILTFSFKQLIQTIMHRPSQKAHRLHASNMARSPHSERTGGDRV